MDSIKTPTLLEAIEEMITTYQDVNGPIEEYNSDPSSSLYAKHIAKNRPFIVRSGCSKWAAARWSARYLQKKMDGKSVKVSHTPLGNADSVVMRPENGQRYFVKPLELEESFSDLISWLQAAPVSSDTSSASVKYSQGPANIHLIIENDNLRSEYLPLLSDVPQSIYQMSESLNSEPDAVNLWLGNRASITSLHQDGYENVYAQIKGVKNFVLIPPVETACVNEQFLPCATYSWPEGWSIVPDDPEVKVPVAVWDPDKPEENPTRFSKLCKPYRVRLGEGDMLYLPACWHHKVSQENGIEGICCSVNYWYDQEFDGNFNATNTFIRNMAWAATHEVSDRPDSMPGAMPK